MQNFAVSVPLSTTAILLSAMALKHYGADFVLQTNWMAHGKERVRGWFAPLAAHALCHAVFTLSIALLVRPSLWWLAVADLLVHAAIDRAKTMVARRGRWEARQAQFWWLMGFDQLLHQLTNIALAAAFLVR